MYYFSTFPTDPLRGSAWSMLKTEDIYYLLRSWIDPLRGSAWSTFKTEDFSRFRGSRIDPLWGSCWSKCPGCGVVRYSSPDSETISPNSNTILARFRNYWRPIQKLYSARSETTAAQHFAHADAGHPLYGKRTRSSTSAQRCTHASHMVSTPARARPLSTGAQ